jgi:hypothetical protein
MSESERWLKGVGIETAKLPERLAPAVDIAFSLNAGGDFFEGSAVIRTPCAVGSPRRLPGRMSVGHPAILEPASSCGDLAKSPAVVYPSGPGVPARLCPGWHRILLLC